MSDDTPTQRLPQSEDPSEERRKSRTLMFVLIGVGAVLLIAIIVLLIILFGGDKGAPSADPTPSGSSTATTTTSPSPTPSASPTPSETAAPQPPAQTGPKINSFASDPTTVACPAPDAPSGGGATYISFTWSTQNVDKVEFGVIDGDGNYQVYFANLPPSGNSATGAFGPGNEDFAFPCGSDEATFVLKATGSGQTKTAQLVVDDVTND